MPRVQSVRIARTPAARRSAKARRPRQAAAVPVEVLGARRCLACGGSFGYLPPATSAQIDAATITLRRHLDRSPTTSADVAAALQIGANQAGDLLLKCCLLGLLARRRQKLPGGGFRYAYRPLRRLAHYIESDTLAAQAAEALAE